MVTDYYQPYGQQWRDQLKRLSKDQIIGLLLDAYKAKVKLERDHNILRYISEAQTRHIERLTNRSRLKCQGSGCEGCAVCDPVQSLI